MKTRIMMISILAFMTTGCMTHAINAWKLSSLEKTLGTKNPEFILKYDHLSVASVRFHMKRHIGNYAFNICNLYNKDIQLSSLQGSGVISKYPTCIDDSQNGNVLNIEVGTPKEKCIPLINCADKYIKYTDGQGNVLAYSEMKNLHYMEGIRYSVGHIKNMVIAANIQANKDNPVWKENLERVCKEDKTLKSVCG